MTFQTLGGIAPSSIRGVYVPVLVDDDGNSDDLLKNESVRRSEFGSLAYLPRQAWIYFHVCRDFFLRSIDRESIRRRADGPADGAERDTIWKTCCVLARSVFVGASSTDARRCAALDRPNDRPETTTRGGGKRGGVVRGGVGGGGRGMGDKILLRQILPLPPPLPPYFLLREPRRHVGAAARFDDVARLPPPSGRRSALSEVGRLDQQLSVIADSSNIVIGFRSDPTPRAETPKGWTSAHATKKKRTCPVFLPSCALCYPRTSATAGNDEVMLQLARMGVGYELWAETAKDAIDKGDDITSILDKIDDEEKPEMEMYKKYLDPNRHDNSLPLSKYNGPFGSMTIVPTADFPAAALLLKKIFLPESSVPSSTVLPSGNIMTLQLPGDIDKEAEAKKGLVKLMLFHVRGNIDIEAITMTNISAAVPSKGMQIIMNQNRASRASSFADLMRMTINEAKAQDWTNIRSSQISIKLISKALASHMLQGNFATEKVTSLEHETEKVEPSAFLPQKNKCLIDREASTENRATNENVMDIIDSQKSTRKTAIARIGTMTDITDFSSLCINMDTVISAICASEEPQPIFRQILMNFVSLINNPDWANGDKRDPSTPDTSDDNKPSVRQQAKKAKKASTKADGPTKDRKEMGMFFLKNPNIPPSDIFPKDLPIKLCANFTCKGKECTNANCGFKHPNKASEIPPKDIGWFNEYHFMKMNDEGVKKLLGNSKGISSKTD
ncbi:hypothetical protein ACHAXA_009153 [Cyclostephanos tholiformis]|uniref:C3H1-type domain-containing protein n=1 Tax=Cyclostephanos tholiformis TaxID=382380 RepID=A0ABD3R2I4_9STRA